MPVNKSQELEFIMHSDPTGEGVYYMSEADMRARLEQLEAHHCEAGRNKRIAELEAECFALAANQCHKPYGDEYGNARCEYQDTVSRMANFSAAVNDKRAYSSIETHLSGARIILGYNSLEDAREAYEAIMVGAA